MPRERPRKQCKGSMMSSTVLEVFCGFFPSGSAFTQVPGQLGNQPCRVVEPNASDTKTSIPYFAGGCADRLNGRAA